MKKDGFDMMESHIKGVPLELLLRLGLFPSVAQFAAPKTRSGMDACHLIEVTSIASVS